jgi:transposase
MASIYMTIRLTICTTNRLQRVEVITGVERRRTWLPEEKLKIVTESCADGVTVSEVARRHGISPQQLFGRRSQLRALAPARVQIEPPPFVAAVVDGATAEPVAMELASRGPNDGGLIEVIIGPAIVRVRGAVDLRALERRRSPAQTNPRSMSLVWCLKL